MFDYMELRTHISTFWALFTIYLIEQTQKYYLKNTYHMVHEAVRTQKGQVLGTQIKEVSS